MGSGGWNKGIPRTIKEKFNISQGIIKAKWGKNTKKKTIIDKCIICGKSKIRRPSEIANGVKRMCSIKCYGKYQSIYRSKENHPEWKGLNKKCIICGKVFHIKPRNLNTKFYCSRICMAKSYREKLKLQNNPNWRDGSSFKPYPIGWRKEFKEIIRKRDNYLCQICGISQKECYRKLSVHHIDYDKNNLSIDNLISLCHKCHPDTNNDRLFWKKRFTSTKYLTA